MEQMMQPRSNCRSLPTLNLREGVSIRRVEEAYQEPDYNNKTSNKRSQVFYVIWIVCVAGLMVWAVMTYPPSLAMLILELLAGVLISGGLFIIKARKP